MNKPNRGKDFEKEIESCFKCIPTVSINRLPDPMGGYSGVKNICDYTVFHSPDNFYIECKSLYGNTLNYKTAISQNQWDGMLEKSEIYKCVAGVAVWFIDYDVTAFINIKDLVAHRNKGNKSLNIDDIVSDKPIKHFLIDGIKKRVKFTYFGEDFLRKLHKLSNDIWGDVKNE